MLRSSESETEILLGNKQLLGIFFVVVVLLGVAFAGGYKVGQAAGKKTPVAAQGSADETASSSGTTAASGGETHALPAAGATGTEQSPSPSGSSSTAVVRRNESGSAVPSSAESGDPPLGSAKHSKQAKAKTPPATASAEPASYITGFAPQGGQTFLQVAAVSRDEAEAIADVLHKKGFRAHAVPKPGAGKIYRVLIGPVRDAGDLSSTRDQLHKTGFHGGGCHRPARGSRCYSDHAES